MKISNEIKNMVDIDTDDFTFSFIRGMYSNGDGIGIQVTKQGQPREREIEAECLVIARAICRLNDLLEDVKK